MDEEKEELLEQAEDAVDQGENAPQTPAEEAPLAEPQPQTRTFTQEEVDRIAGNSRAEGRNSAMKGYIDRYGVESEDELDGLFRNGQLYDGLNERNAELTKENSDLKRQLALTSATLRDGLDPSAYDDVVAIAESKGMDLSAETIRTLMETRPYWRKDGAAAPQPQPQGFSAPAPNPAPAPQPQTNPMEEAIGGLPPDLATLPEEGAPAPTPVPQTKSVLTRLGGQPHAAGSGSAMSPEDLAKSLAGVGR